MRCMVKSGVMAQTRVSPPRFWVDLIFGCVHIVAGSMFLFEDFSTLVKILAVGQIGYGLYLWFPLVRTAIKNRWGSP